MGLRINTNVAALNTTRILNRSTQDLNKSLQRLSSGLRINRAADDAAGLAISDRMTSQVRGLNQAARNANDGISMLQTAEGAMDEISNALQRMRELAVQAATGTVNDTDKASLNDEYQALGEEINRIVAATTFNETPLLSNTTPINLQVGYQSDPPTNQVQISFADLSALTSVSDLDSAGGTDNISTEAGALAALDAIDADIDTVSGARADVGALQNRLESTIRNLANIVENQSAARSRIRDADFAAETANLTRTQILQQAGTAMLAQANAIPQSVLQLLG